MAFIDRQAPERLAASLRAALVTLTGLRDGDGTWPEAELVRYASNIKVATQALNQIEADLAKNAPAVLVNLAAAGGPDNVTDFGTQGAAIETAAAAFRTLVKNAVASMTAAEARPTFVDVQVGSRVAGQLVRWQGVPAAQADPLRTSQELADLIAALEAAGA